MTGRTDTIFAKASGAGRAGVAVFRLSGPASASIAHQLTGMTLTPRRVDLVQVRDPQDGSAIDHGLAILFAAPASFTGEDVVELHLHGSLAVEKSLYACLEHIGARPAEAGEFTRRALINGKLDLAQVEGLADLIDAETSAQRKQALGQLGGRLSELADGWRDRLLAILAPLEADIDFPDEEDVPAAIAAKAGPAIEALVDELRRYLDAASANKRLRDGVRIVILGQPNAGKSSLLNYLLKDDRAIVSPQAGTTRDVVEARLELDGFPVTLVDTAGLRRSSADEIEKEGMRRTRLEMDRANIAILVIDGAALTVPEDVQRFIDENVSRETPVIIAYSKSDIDNVSRETKKLFPGVSLSTRTGTGVPALTHKISEILGDVPAGEVGLTRARHELAVRRAVEHLSAGRRAVQSAPELAAEDVRMAARSLGAITGQVDVEDVLGEIFSSFCIGK